MSPSLDHVLAVVEDRGQALVEVRHVVAAVEVVVDEDLPVALEGPAPALDELEALELQLRELADERTECRLERGTARLEPHEDELLPDGGLDRNEAVPALVEVADAGEVRRSLQLAREGVRPPVVRAAQDRRLPGLLGHHRRGMVAADVEEPAELPVLAAHDDDGLAREHRRHVLAGLRELVDPADHLPGPRKDGAALELGDAVVDVPGRGDRPGLVERGPRVVGIEDLPDRGFHGSSLRGGGSTPGVSGPGSRSSSRG